MPIYHKFKRKITERNGIKFASKKEAQYYDNLVSFQKSGDLLFFLMQVPFHLPGPTKAVIDFVEFWSDGSVKFVDVKGMRTRSFIRNKKQIEALYPVEIIEK
jgi:hypothetical protein